MNENEDLNIETINRLLANAHCLFTQEEVNSAIKKMAAEIGDDYSELNPIVMCIMTGGLVFCGELLLNLSFPLMVDYAHTSRYRAGAEPGVLEWISVPHITLENRHVLLVDDILDEGHTLQSLLNACIDKGAASVKSAVLINKKHNRKVEPAFMADYVALHVDDHYIFGYGMDYQGYLRNAPGIYALDKK